MKLRKLTTKNFRGVPDRTYSFGPPDEDEPSAVTLVTGGPASGKTGLLEAIIAAKEDVGAYGLRPASSSVIRAGATSAAVDAVWWLSPGERRGLGVTVETRSIFGDGAPAAPEHPAALRALLREHSRDPVRGKVELFHAERVLPAQRGGRHGVPDLPAAVEAGLRLANDNQKYVGLRSYLTKELLNDALALASSLRESGVALRARADGAESELRALLRPVLHEKVLDGLDGEGEGYRVRFRPRDGGALDLDELGAEERQGVLFALTFRRLGLNHSLVLIDGPELHVHPTRQADFLGAITKFGQDNQIIAATASAEVLKALPPEQVVHL